MRVSEKYNRSGCLDMTAYLAIRNIDRYHRLTHTYVNAPVSRFVTRFSDVFIILHKKSARNIAYRSI